MALTSKSLIRYGLTVDVFNANLYINVGAGLKHGYLNYGYYTVDSLCVEVIRVMLQLAPGKIFTYSIDRTISGGTQCRVTFSCTSAPFTIDFSQASTVGPSLGFNPVVYSGLLSYTGSADAGTTLIPELIGYNYLGPEFQKQVNGTVNISAVGLKEAVVFQLMQFVQVEFKYEPQAKVISQWASFWDWAIQQKVFEFTPQISDAATTYQVTLEKSQSDGKGLGFRMTEMLPEFPFYYRTGLFTMRKQVSTTFITG